jgi:predicted small metal-binding protein
MRVIDCDCGKTLQAANDEDLVQAVRGHMAEDHPDMDLSDEEVEQLVRSRAYDAQDA